MTEPYSSIRLTAEFLQSWGDRKFTAEDRARLLRALRLLDSNEKHPSLRVHALRGDMEGSWSASASDALRIEFERGEGGVKILVRCTKHYER
jgi:hypothetical protein